MNTTSRTITGTIMIIFGVCLLVVPLFAGVGGFVAWFYGVPLFVIGIFLLLNKKEDNIEGRKDKK
jgi:uncharacterized membrane protein HdeD (DUF308 family)